MYVYCTLNILEILNWYAKSTEHTVFAVLSIGLSTLDPPAVLSPHVVSFVGIYQLLHIR